MAFLNLSDVFSRNQDRLPFILDHDIYNSREDYHTLRQLPYMMNYHDQHQQFSF